MRHFTFAFLSFVLFISDSAFARESASPVLSLIETRQKNVVLQQWELSCASAALATVLRYQHGFPVTERAVALGMINREEYLSNPDLLRYRQGFSLLDMKRFVDSIGYEGLGLGQLNIEDLIEYAPIIVPVDLQGYPHFVVFRGATSNQVLLADPAFGNITLSKEKFIDGWIEYRDIDRVGFVVGQDGKRVAPGRLSASAMDFVILN